MQAQLFGCVSVMFDFEPLSTDTDINSDLVDNADNVFIFIRYHYQQFSLSAKH